VYPVAELLAALHIPFLFLTGYGEGGLPPGHADWKVCAKPFRARELATLMSATLGGVSGS
jgi:hypothetical protein